jgi:hypothetical protein
MEGSYALKGKQLGELLAPLTEDERTVNFIFTVEYSSLENIKWRTQVIYEVTCKAGDRRMRLNSIRSATDDFAQLWSNGAQVALDARVKAGSWLHQRI